MVVVGEEKSSGAQGAPLLFSSYTPTKIELSFQTLPRLNGSRGWQVRNLFLLVRQNIKTLFQLRLKVIIIVSAECIDQAYQCINAA
jgi:hypothetical protein